MTVFPNNEKICRIENPQDWSEEKSQIFIAAIQEMASFHYENSKEIGFLYRRENFNPLSIEKETDLERIPCLGVTGMKYYLMTSLPESEAVLRLTSSGTRGQKTQVWFDKGSLDRAQGMMDVLWGQERLVSDALTNYCAFIYDPTEAKDLGIAFSVNNETRFAKKNEAFFSVKRNTLGNWEFQIEQTIQKLENYVEQGFPVRLLGIPSFMYELIENLMRREMKILLPKNSWALVGGGWKAAEDKKITREKFRALITDYLGIPDASIRDGYGMAEHSAPYLECPLHRFHIPAFNRVLVRDPITLTVLPKGQVGLLEFMTPFNAMMPTVALLSTDLGYLDEEPCECGRNSPVFTLVGRGGLTKHKGCAMTATDIVKRT